MNNMPLEFQKTESRFGAVSPDPTHYVARCSNSGV